MLAFTNVGVPEFKEGFGLTSLFEIFGFPELRHFEEIEYITVFQMTGNRYSGCGVRLQIF